MYSLAQHLQAVTLVSHRLLQSACHVGAASARFGMHALIVSSTGLCAASLPCRLVLPSQCKGGRCAVSPTVSSSHIHSHARTQRARESTPVSMRRHSHRVYAQTLSHSTNLNRKTAVCSALSVAASLYDRMQYAQTQLHAHGMLASPCTCHVSLCRCLTRAMRGTAKG